MFVTHNTLQQEKSCKVMMQRSTHAKLSLVRKKMTLTPPDQGLLKSHPFSRLRRSLRWYHACFAGDARKTGTIPPLFGPQAGNAIQIRAMASSIRLILAQP